MCVLRFTEENALFSGDHVMAWSTSVIAPPDGSMTDYMASLEKLRGRNEAIFWPGHGGPVVDPQRYLRALIGHRRQREAAILRGSSAAQRRFAQIVEAAYFGLDPSSSAPRASRRSRIWRILSDAGLLRGTMASRRSIADRKALTAKVSV